MKYALLGIGVCATAFGCVGLFLGYDGTIVSGVFGLLGTIAGYIIGSRQTS